MSKNIEFQRRHFEFIADVLANVTTFEGDRRIVIDAFARELRRTNPQFDAEKFRTRALGGRE